MSAYLGTVALTGVITPKNVEDQYPVIDPLFGIDGLRNVFDAAERELIPELRRRAGMIVGTQDDSKYWRLLPGPWTYTSADWAEWPTSSGGGGTPALPFTSVQWNNSGVFGGDSGLTWNNSAKTLKIIDNGHNGAGTSFVIYSDNDLVNPAFSVRDDGRLYGNCAQTGTTGENTYFGYFTTRPTGSLFKDNTYIGYNNVTYNNSAEGNINVGYRSVGVNELAVKNIAIGYYDLAYLKNNNQAISNVTIGRNAGITLAHSENNIAVGTLAGYNISYGIRNIIMGYNAAYNMSYAEKNISIGTYDDLLNASQAYSKNNVMLGTNIGLIMPYAEENIMIGKNIGSNLSPTTNSVLYNIFIGNGIGVNGVNARSNIVIGKDAGVNIGPGGTASSSRENILIGSGAGYNSIGSNNNINIGYHAGYNPLATPNTDLVVNIGYEAGYNNVADGLITIGYQAGKANTNGSANTYIGFQSGLHNVSGNVLAIGFQSLYNSTGVASSTVIGNFAGFNLISGGANTLIGYNAGYGSTNAVFSTMTLIGNEAGRDAVAGSQNVAIGDSPMQYTRESYYNVAIGSYALRTISTRIILGASLTNNAGHVRVVTDHELSNGDSIVIYSSTVAGYNGTYPIQLTLGDPTYFDIPSLPYTANATANIYHMHSDLEAGHNVAIGQNVLTYLHKGSENVAIGYLAGEDAHYSDQVFGAGHNVYIGAYAGRETDEAYGNVYIGWSAAIQSFQSYNNVVIGKEAMSGENAELSSGNVVIGYRAGYLMGNSNTQTTDDNVFIGREAGYTATHTRENVSIGAESGMAIGEGNVFIGFQAGKTETLSDKLYISNSDTIYPLIYGDFSVRYVTIHDEIRFALHNDAAPNLHYVGFRPKSGMLINTTYTWPGTYGSNGMVLTTNGAGILEWTSAGAGTMMGTLEEHQIAFGSAADTIDGSNNFTWRNTERKLTIIAKNHIAPPGDMLINIKDDDDNIIFNMYENGDIDGARIKIRYYYTTFIGANAGLNSTENNNTFIGGGTGQNITQQGNTAVGTASMTVDNLGYNTSIGTDSSTRMSGGYNVVAGYFAGYGIVGNGFNSPYSNSSLIGSYAAKRLVNGSDLIAIGYNAISNTYSTYNNIGIGTNALNLIGSLSNGASPVSFGTDGTSPGNVRIYSGNSGLSVGMQVLLFGSNWTNSIDENDSFTVINVEDNWFDIDKPYDRDDLGNWYYQYAISAQENNIAIGIRSLYTMRVGSNNIALGYQSGIGTNNSYNNILMGYNTAAGASDIAQNIYIGSLIGASNGEEATQNVIIGYSAAVLHSSHAEGNVVIGAFAAVNMGHSNSTKSEKNVIVGAHAGQNLYHATQNVMIGYGAGPLMGSPDQPAGDGNVFIGYNAGQTEYLSDKLYIANSATETPLMYGDFSAKYVTIYDEIRFADTSTRYYNGFKTSASQLVNLTYIWPTTYGVAGYVLSTDGAGNLSWVAKDDGGSISKPMDQIVYGVDTDVSSDANFMWIHTDQTLKIIASTSDGTSNIMELYPSTEGYFSFGVKSHGALFGRTINITADTNYNTYIGYGAGLGTSVINSTTEAGNVFIGYNSAHLIGDDSINLRNVSIGNSTMSQVGITTDNIAIGYQALNRLSSTGIISNVVFLGTGPTTVTVNTGVIYHGLSDGDNVVVYGMGEPGFDGIWAISNVTVNTFVLVGAIPYVTADYGDIIGYKTVSSAYNIAIGQSAGVGVFTAENNIMIGKESAFEMYDGDNNIILGRRNVAKRSNGGPTALISGFNDNIVIGDNAALGAMGSTKNILIGHNVLSSVNSSDPYTNTGTTKNVIIGYDAVSYRGGGPGNESYENVIIGYNSAGSLSDTIGSVIIGSNAGGANGVTSPSMSVLIGAGSGDHALDKSILIGYGTGLRTSPIGAFEIGINDGSNDLNTWPLISGNLIENSPASIRNVNIDGKFTISRPNSNLLQYVGFSINAATTAHSYLLPVNLPAANDYIMVSSTAGQMEWKSLSSLGGGGSSLTSTYIGFGSGANTLTGDSTLTWDNTEKLMTIHGKTALTGMPAFRIYSTGVTPTKVFEVDDAGGLDGTGIHIGVINSSHQNIRLGRSAGTQLSGSSGEYNFLAVYQSGASITTGSGNIGIGFQTLTGVQTGSYNIALGYQAGVSMGSATDNSIYIGYKAGQSDASNDMLYITGRNDISTNPTTLIKGQFYNGSNSPFVQINGELIIGNSAESILYKFPTTAGTSGYVLTSGGAGNSATWSDLSGAIVTAGVGFVWTSPRPTAQANFNVNVNNVYGYGMMLSAGMLISTISFVIGQNLTVTSGTPTWRVGVYYYSGGNTTLVAEGSSSPSITIAGRVSVNLSSVYKTTAAGRYYFVIGYNSGTYNSVALSGITGYIHNNSEIMLNAAIPTSGALVIGTTISRTPDSGAPYIEIS